ncbi:NAD(P)-dependent oxidoreductase, partial [Candidatus Dependentiae bacterium]|nr:NAD(P)-dependent oxidoreductase [Candidatus Dependentiae bacterium]
MKILITGITSELLQRLVKLIDAKTCDITGVTRFPEKISSEKIKIIKGDICDPDTAEKIITDDMDMIIHGAAVTHSRDENEYFKVNLNSTISIINFLKQKNRKCMFVFISSRTAGKKSGAYGFSKFLAEEYIRKNLNRWLIFRPSEIFGTEKKEGIGKLISDALAKSIIFYPANMKYKIYPIHIDDVVNIMYESIFITRKSNEIITINGNEGYTYYELLKCISSINKRKIMFIPIPKFLLFLLKYIIKILSLKIFITPDQIDR